MKSKYIGLALAGLALTATLNGCYDMDTIPMNSNLTEEQKVDAKEQNPALTQAGIAGIAALFSTWDQAFGQEIHSDFGIPALMLGLDCRTADMVSTFSGYNHFRTFMAFSDCNTNSYASRMAWQYNYNQILACNTAIGDINADTTDPTVQFYLGQALAMRANAYFTLAQLFQFPYVGHESDACVMLITEKNQEEVLRNGTPRATVEQVYDLISSDLDRAIELISASGIRPEQVLENKPKRFVSLATAYGLRARVNLVKEQWADAATDARDAIDAFAGRPLTMAEAAMPGFNSIDAANWMWGIAISESDEVVLTGICNFPSHMGSLNYGYASVGAWRGINRKLFGEIPETDVRRGWFLDADGQSENLTEQQAAYCARQGAPAFTQVKFAPYQGVVGTTQNASDVPLMRVEEMYLIEAEATAMAGGNGAALLTSFVNQYRDPAFSVGSSAAEVQEECFRQRRVELFGEGRIYFDYLRLHKGCDRVGGGFEPNYCYNIPADDQIFILPIPNLEINGNKLFTSGANNPPVPQPSPVQDIVY